MKKGDKVYIKSVKNGAIGNCSSGIWTINDWPCNNRYFTATDDSGEYYGMLTKDYYEITLANILPEELFII
jgi:hypothetical protein